MVSGDPLFSVVYVLCLLDMPFIGRIQEGFALVHACIIGGLALSARALMYAGMVLWNECYT